MVIINSLVGDQGGEMQEERKKHFILVHGMCQGAWSWYKLATLLRSAGHGVTAVDLGATGVHPQRLDELRSFDDYVKPLLDVMASVPAHEKVVLVGHSFGGASVAFAMEAFPEKIAVAVFVTAVMPSTSVPMASLAEEYFKGHPLEAFMDSKVEITQGQRSFSLAFGNKYSSTKLYQLSPPEDLTLATLLLRPGSFFVGDLSNNMILTEKNYGSVSRAFTVCEQEKSMVEDFRLWMIKRSPEAEAKEIDGADHMVRLSKRKELCDLLVEIADKHQQ